MKLFIVMGDNARVRAVFSTQKAAEDYVVFYKKCGKNFYINADFNLDPDKKDFIHAEDEVAKRKAQRKKLVSSLKKEFPDLEFQSGPLTRCISLVFKQTIDILEDDSIRMVDHTGLPNWKIITMDTAKQHFKKWNNLKVFQ